MNTGNIGITILFTTDSIMLLNSCKRVSKVLDLVQITVNPITIERTSAVITVITGSIFNWKIISGNSLVSATSVANLNPGIIKYPATVANRAAPTDDK